MDLDKRRKDEFDVYKIEQLSIPIGAQPNQVADYNFDAATAGWTPGGHSDHKDLNPQVIYPWYKRFLASSLTPSGAVDPTGIGGTAIAIGKE